MKKDARSIPDKGAIDAESIIIGWAKAGLLAEAGKAAITKSHARGLSVTLSENGVIFRLHPDGSKTFIREIPQVPAHKYVKRIFKVNL